MSNNNLELWDKVFTTDTQYTKPAKKGAYNFTSITPMYQKMVATKALGPQGIGWGVEVGSESFEYKEVGTTTLLIYRAVMFYKFGGEVGRIPIAATEKLCYQTQGANGYLKIDDEADKKVRTAALTKGLSEIGVTADIHMGLHENHEYQEYSSAKLRIESGDSKEIRAVNDEFKEWFVKESKSLHLAPSANAVNMMYDRINSKMADKLTIIKASQDKRQQMVNRLFAEAEKAKENLANKDSK